MMIYFTILPACPLHLATTTSVIEICSLCPPFFSTKLSLQPPVLAFQVYRPPFFLAKFSLQKPVLALQAHRPPFFFNQIVLQKIAMCIYFLPCWHFFLLRARIFIHDNSLKLHDNCLILCILVSPTLSFKYNHHILLHFFFCCCNSNPCSVFLFFTKKMLEISTKMEIGKTPLLNF